MKTKILCLHQSAELYGSDRSFLSAVEGLCNGGSKPDVIVPFQGPLVEKLARAGASTSFFSFGILRKQLLKNPFSYCLEVIRAVIFYVNKFRSYDTIYINTSVMLAAIVAATFYRFSNKRIYCHVREIPSKWQIVFFKIIFILSGVKLIFNSESTKYNFGLSGVVIYNGIATPAFFEKKESCEEQINILLIGRINTWKGQLLLIESVSMVNGNRRKNFKVRIVGSPFEGYEYLELELKQKVSELGLDEYVEFTGFCDDPSEHYLWADYIVVPSTKPEPFGRVAVEAFSIGKPVVAANHGGLVEIVSHELNGFLFVPSSPDDLKRTLEELPSTNSEKYNYMSSNAVKTYKSKFSEKAYQDKVSRLLVWK